MAGFQMEFDEEVDDNYEIYNSKGYKVAVEKKILKDNNYIEIKYSTNFISPGFYPSVLGLEE